MPEYVYLNDRLVAAEEAKISVYDHGFLYGDGIFETMRAYHGRVFCLEEHLERLFESARLVAMKLPWSKADLAAAVQATIDKNQLTGAYVRLTVSRGTGPLGLDPRLCPQPTLVIMARPFSPKPELYEKGVKTIIVTTRRNLKEALPPQIKSLNFINNILAKIETIAAGAYEGIMLNYQGQVTEGTVSNLFIVKNNSVMTPSADSGILVGVTRNVVLALARGFGLEVNETFLYREDLYLADEMFLTNASGELIPVVEIDGRQVASGKPGPMTLKLLREYRRLAEKEPKIGQK